MTDQELKLNDILAFDRTKLAAERTLMAWIRSALGMIGFGFTIFHFLQVVQEHSKVPVLYPNAPRDVGLTLIGIGTFSLLVACRQHWKYVKNLRPGQPYIPWDLSVIVACLIALLGFLMFASVIYRSGLYG